MRVTFGRTQHCLFAEELVRLVRVRVRVRDRDGDGDGVRDGDADADRVRDTVRAWD